MSPAPMQCCCANADLRELIPTPSGTGRLPLERPLPQKSITKAGVGVRVIRSYQETLLPIRNCFVDPAFCKKNVSAVVIGICIIRFQS